MQKKQKYIWLFARLFVSLHSELSTMKKTLSARLTYRIMAVVLVMMSIIASVVYFTVRQYMLDAILVFSSKTVRICAADSLTFMWLWKTMFTKLSATLTIPT